MNNMDAVPDPFGPKEELKPGEPNTTRLMEIGYTCHLCGNEHGAEYYITASLNDMTTMLDKLSMGEKSDYLENFLDDEGFRNSVGIMAHRTHEDLGNLAQLIHEYDAKAEKPTITFTRIIVTPETNYTCNYCGRTFESIGLLRMHQGQDPFSKKQIIPMSGGCRGPTDRK